MSSVSAERPARREIELDFIRGIAILLVMDFHSRYGITNLLARVSGTPPVGWAGVDIFFVLSGFLVGGLLVKEWKVRGRINSSSFLIRRGFKIWPQYYFFIFALLVTRHRTVKELWGNLLNIQNYVGGVAHTWSLAVEEHAYVAILLLLIVAARRKLRMRTLFAILAASIACVVCLEYYLAARSVDIFPLTHTRLGGIFAGVMLAILYHYRPESFQRLQSMWWLWWAAIVAALAYIYVARDSWRPASMINLADLCGVASLMLLYRRREGIRHGRLYRMVAWIGLYSYGIYLWHVSVEAPVNWVAERLQGPVGIVWLATAPMLLGIATGVVTTEAIEFPMLRLRERWFPRRVDSAVGTPAEEERPQVPVPARVNVEG